MFLHGSVRRSPLMTLADHQGAGQTPYRRAEQVRPDDQDPARADRDESGARHAQGLVSSHPAFTFADLLIYDIGSKAPSKSGRLRPTSTSRIMSCASA